MTALEWWVDDEDRGLVSLECTFNNPVSVDDEVVFRQREAGNGNVLLEASVGDLPCAKIRLTARAGSTASAGIGSGDALAERLVRPADEEPGHHLRVHAYALALAPVEDAAARFPRLHQRIGAARVTGLMALSYFVGMVCPGLNSIFASVSLKFDAGAGDAGRVTFSVDRYDDRFHLFHVGLGGVFNGRLTAFQRPPPQSQPGIDEIATQIARDEFGGSRALVIGASRGLGETVAKMLAAGGADVTLTYAQGRDDAERVSAEINARHADKSRTRRLDIAAPEWGAVPFAEFDAIFIFATPRIGRKKAGLYASALLGEFIAAYADVLYELCLHIENLALPQRIRVYAPSTVFIAERPEGFVEYAMAKAAMEVLIDEINRTFKRVSVLVTRLPRLSTDQTSSLLKVSTGDTIDALLPVVRAMTTR